MSYNDKTYYYHKNIFGDIIGILNTSYKEIVTYEYDSWGTLINITDNSGINLGTINPFRYRSYYYDTETGLYYLNSRYYNPEWGRFVNADGIVSSNDDYISNNLFTYVSNNPIINFDASGNELVSSIGLGAIITGVAGAVATGLFAAGVVTLSIVAITGVAYYSYEAISTNKVNSQTKTISNKNQSSPKGTVIYRYGDSSPSNLTPKEKDANTGLSFSTIPPAPGKKAVITTVEAIEATGVLIAEHDGLNHYSIKPVNAPVSVWIMSGNSSLWTLTLKNICVKWDGGQNNYE